MKSTLTTALAFFFLLLAGTASAATVNYKANSLQTIHTDIIYADEEKKKKVEEEEPECD